MKIFVWKTFCFFTAVTLFSVSVSAQQKSDKSNGILYATVASPELKFIQNLKQENFLLNEDKKALKIVSLSRKDEPISVGILLDISGSNKSGRGKKTDKTKWARENISIFLKNSNPQNEYFLAAFAAQYNLLSDYTSSVGDLQNILSDDSNFLLKGNTSLFDALKDSFDKIAQGKEQKRVLILISDGMDNSSSASYGKIKELTKANDVIIYLIDITNPDFGNLPRLQEKYNQTRDLVKLSGGETFIAENSITIQKQFLYLSNLLRNQYKIEFEKNLTGRKNKWKEIDVKLNLTKDEEERLNKPKVITRTGYWVL